ncbi:MAG: hypothetical protein AAB417_00720 [Patescibacteria group bacterium]
MAINWNMNIESLGALFKKRKTSSRVSGALIPATKKVWRFSIMFLAIFAVLVVACDAYIFWEYVINQQDVDIGERGTVVGINRALFDNVSNLIDERATRFGQAKTVEPIRNPFDK